MHSRLYLALSILLTMSVIRPVYADPPPEVAFAILIGSAGYKDKDYQSLRFADADVVRFSTTLAPFVSLENQLLLIQPSSETRRALPAGDSAPWLEPTVDNVRQAFGQLQERLEAARHALPNARVRVVVYISAHGDEKGIHLEDGRLTVEDFRGLIQSITLDASQVLLVADSCYSDTLRMKGKPGRRGRVDLGPDEIAEAMRRVRVVGSVTARTVTVENEFIRGGILTHVVSSGMVGLADLDDDGRIAYDELRAFLDAYVRDKHIKEVFRVTPPADHLENPPLVVDLHALPQTGLEFGPGDADEVTCFWIRNEGMQMVAELCRPKRETRRVYLPPGRYHVLRWTPSHPNWDHEGTVEVGVGFQKVDRSRLSTPWKSSSSAPKGEEHVAFQAPASARPLTPEEESYLTTTPIDRPIGWRSAPGHLQGAVRLGVSIPGRPLQVGDIAYFSENSLSQEKASGELSGILDWRALRGGGGYVALGLELGGGLEPGTAYQTQTGVTVATGRVRLRLGYERPFRRWTARLTAASGIFTAVPTQVAANVQAQAAVDTALPTFAAPSGTLELSIATHMESAWALEVGGGPALALEPQDLGGERPALVPYPGASAFFGLRW